MTGMLVLGAQRILTKLPLLLGFTVQVSPTLLKPLNMLLSTSTVLFEELLLLLLLESEVLSSSLYPGLSYVR